METREAQKIRPQHFTPGQVMFGGCLLAFGASFINTGFLLNTGASGLSSWHAVNFQAFLAVLIATVGFILGATLSGYFLHHPTLQIQVPYGRTLMICGLLLLAGHFLYATNSHSSIGLGSLVCGIQNSLASRYRGLILRTTHLTGLFTDLGINLGMKFRGHSIESWKLVVPILLFLSFFAGAISSGFIAITNHHSWLLYAGIAYLLGGLSWSCYKRVHFQRQPRNAHT